MKNEFVADGYRRFSRGRKSRTAESIQKKYAEALAGASPVQKLKIHAQIMKEKWRGAKAESHKPSPGALW
jgi:hypothetical protein